MVHYLNIYIKFVNKKIFYDEGGDNINNVENKTIQGGPERAWWAFENLILK